MSSGFQQSIELQIPLDTISLPYHIMISSTLRTAVVGLWVFFAANCGAISLIVSQEPGNETSTTMWGVMFEVGIKV